MVDPIDRQLVETVKSVFREVMQQKEGRPLTADEIALVENGIEIADTSVDRSEYEFNCIVELVSRGIGIDEAQRQAREETSLIYDD